MLLRLAVCSSLLMAACGTDGVATTADGGASPTPVPTGTTSTPAGPLRIVVPDVPSVDEERLLEVSVRTEGGAATSRLFAEDLPPGASWDEPAGKLSFRPDFTQGGHAWTVRFTADDGATRASATVAIRANDTIVPPAPVVTKTETLDGYARLTVTQTTDAFLDSPGYAGRTFTAVVLAPLATAKPLPVRVGLHGFGGVPETAGWSGEFRIYPSDPNDTYWWGYASSLPGAAPSSATGDVPDYTARRVVHLLAWVLATYPAADADRVYLDGVSMGGAGAMTIGLLHARHFCHVRAGYGQAIPKNHRPSRLAQLRGLWGTPELGLSDGQGMSMWDRSDLTRVLRDVPEARDQFLTLHHAKDDPTIHFGAVVTPSTLTGATFYGALQAQHVGHLAIWDEGAHVVPDPLLGDGWWSTGWDPVFDTTSLLRRGRAFVAFSAASLDRNPGTGKGNGLQPWNAESGYAGKLATVGDTGWDGDIAGGINRGLRWDGTRIVDTLEAFEVPVRVLDGAGGAPPRSGYPTTGDKLAAPLPVTVSITPRRTQSFRCRSGERVSWRLGTQTGAATADATGAVTIAGVSLGASWETLQLTRAK